MKLPSGPTDATSNELSRAAFISIAGATVISGATQPELGKPHPPLVSDDDPAIVIRHMMLQSAGATIDAFAAAPIHIWGVDISMRDVAKRLAKHGYVAICPNLYARQQNAPTGDGATDFRAFYPHMKALERPTMDADFDATSSWLRVQHPHAKQAINAKANFSAVVPFYGAVADIDPKLIEIPVCGSYGERDTSIPAHDVRTFSKALHVPHDIKIYPEAGHAFFDDQRASYVASAAHDAWKRVLAFLPKYMRAA